MNGNNSRNGSLLYVMILWLSGIAVLTGCEQLQPKPRQCPVIPELPQATVEGVWLTPQDMSRLLQYIEENERSCQ